jgi:DnaK suppressor protein
MIFSRILRLRSGFRILFGEQLWAVSLSPNFAQAVYHHCTARWNIPQQLWLWLEAALMKDGWCSGATLDLVTGLTQAPNLQEVCLVAVFLPCGTILSRQEKRCLWRTGMSVSNEELKQHLLGERLRLLEQVSRTAESEHQGAGYGNHIADDATETFEQEVGVSLWRNEVYLLKQVEHALQKFEQGTYGICELCGAPIDRARLKALPYALYCLECKARMERGG